MDARTGLHHDNRGLLAAVSLFQLYTDAVLTADIRILRARHSRWIRAVFSGTLSNSLASNGAGFCFNTGRILASPVLIWLSAYMKSKLELQTAIILRYVLFARTIDPSVSARNKRQRTAAGIVAHSSIRAEGPTYPLPEAKPPDVMQRKSRPEGPIHKMCRPSGLLMSTHPISGLASPGRGYVGPSGLICATSKSPVVDAIGGVLHHLAVVATTKAP